VILESLAEAGNKEAYFEIGNIYERSDTEVDQNFETARYWYMKAVEDYDDPYGYFGLARIALKNHTNAGSLSDAIEYLQYACEREDIPPTLTLLGVMYQGKGLPKDLEQAAKLYDKAIAKGYSTYHLFKPIELGKKAFFFFPQVAF
jgi:TPR repeat protein